MHREKSDTTHSDPWFSSLCFPKAPVISKLAFLFMKLPQKAKTAESLCQVSVSHRVAVCTLLYVHHWLQTLKLPDLWRLELIWTPPPPPPPPPHHTPTKKEKEKRKKKNKEEEYNRRCLLLWLSLTLSLSFHTSEGSITLQAASMVLQSGPAEGSQWNTWAMNLFWAVCITNAHNLHNRNVTISQHRGHELVLGSAYHKPRQQNCNQQ